MRKIAIVLAAVAAMALSTMSMASAGAERYQFTDYTVDVQAVNGGPTYAHSVDLRFNPCEETWTSTDNGTFTDTFVDASIVNEDTYVGNYEVGGVAYEFTVELVAGSPNTLGAASTDPAFVENATGTWSVTRTTYNHGEYVAESIDDYGPDAHSCIGKPIVSGGK